MTRVIWKNRQLLNESEAHISIYDSAMIFGDCVFEMTRSFKGAQFKLVDHLERLYRSARYLRINIPYTLSELEQACYETQDCNEFEPDDEHRLMINVTRGLLSIYKNTGKPGPNVIISDFPLRWTTAGMGKLFDTGINAVIPSQRAIPAELLEPKVKNRSRIHYLMANIEAGQMKGDNNWPLMLDPDGFIAECPGANFVIVKGGKLYTPEGRNVLRGISLSYVNWLVMEGMIEKNLELYDVMDADEAFVTGTPFCMLPVTSINGVHIGDGKVGPKFNSILNVWGEMVGVGIKSQIQAWDRGRVEGETPYQFK